MLIAAAAERWQVMPEQCRTAPSIVHGPNGQSAKYAELATEAARKPVPATARLKNPSEFRLVGKKMRRLDSRPKCNGSLKYGLDLDLSGMLVAVVAHPPVFGAKVKSVDDKAARSVEGVREVFEIPLARGATGIAVVADRFWSAKRGRDLLKIEWEFFGRRGRRHFAVMGEVQGTCRATGNVAVARGDEGAIEKIAASNRIVAEYEFPYLAHAPMEPLNTTVRFGGDRAEVWAGSQFQTRDQAAIAEVLGLKAGDSHLSPLRWPAEASAAGCR